MIRNITISFRDREWVILVILLFTTFVSFGLLIPWLGFFWDDWPVIYMIKTQGVNGFWEFYQYDRPFSAWTYIVFSPILGTQPILWHIFTLTLRWLTGMFIWLCLKEIWPQKKLQAFWIALLFVACPIFIFQHVSVAYSQHWISYLLYFISVFFMLKWHNAEQYSFLIIFFSITFSVVHMLTMEYFIGLELLRPVILFLYYRERSSNLNHRSIVWSVLKSWWIFAVVFLAVVVWRMFILQLAGADPNQLVFPSLILNSPLDAVIDLAQKATQDFLYLIISWITAIAPNIIELDRPFSLAALIVVVVFGVGIWFALNNNFFASLEEEKTKTWYYSAFTLGLFAIFFGMLPVWMIGRQVAVGGIANRFSFAALFGVCVTLVAILEWVSPFIKTKTAIVCVLLVIAVHTNLYNAKVFQASWEKQRNFYWQLFWRAPHIQPNTPIVSDGEIFPYVGLYSTSMAISLLYPSSDNSLSLQYWFYSYGRDIYNISPTFKKGIDLDADHRNLNFFGNSLDSVIVFYAPENNTCLQVLSKKSIDDPYLPDSTRGLASVSNLSRILPQPLDNHFPSNSIFGPEPEHNWCYFYEKAELAYQFEDWQSVIRIMDNARKEGLRPSEIQEYLPLLDAYLLISDFKSALVHSVRMKNLSSKLDDRICKAWLNTQIDKENNDYQANFLELNNRIDCFD